MTKKLDVENLSFQTAESDLDNLFAQAGEVESVRIITDRETGRSRGFGFVEMREQNAQRRFRSSAKRSWTVAHSRSTERDLR